MQVQVPAGTRAAGGEPLESLARTAMWRFRVHGWNVADLRSCPWCCPRYCAPDARGRVSSLSQAPLRSSTLPRASGAQLALLLHGSGCEQLCPRIRGATPVVTFLWCTDAGDGCCGSPPPWCEMLKCCREGVPCFSAVSLRLRHHPVRRRAVLRWLPARGVSLSVCQVVSA
ncbi:hypothetical protein PG2006B_1352 [Bifidobacterium animalis subsp. animalis]|nr:hypothetical protein PG2006B_1352 [Bifidobacterium animalis subsp. animalis]